jgi:hypothetical protein
MSTTINLYIPRILGNVSNKKIKTVFHELAIGKIFYIDMHYRINENNKPYYFAFISVNLYDTYEAREFYKDIILYGIIKVTYDKEKNQYWEVKQNIERGLRFIETPLEYRKGLEKEYDDLQKEIFYMLLHMLHL